MKNNMHHKMHIVEVLGMGYVFGAGTELGNIKGNKNHIKPHIAVCPPMQLSCGGLFYA